MFTLPMFPFDFTAAALLFVWPAGVDVSGAAKEGMEASAKEVKMRAGEVERGSVTDAKRIDEASARAYRALARERFVEATEAWTNKDVKTTGRALKEADDCLEAEAFMAGRDASASAINAANATRILAGKLVQGSGWTSDEVGQGFDAFGKQLANLGNRVSSKVNPRWDRPSAGQRAGKLQRARRRQEGPAQLAREASLKGEFE